jgi:hypothetical protein
LPAAAKRKDGDAAPDVVSRPALHWLPAAPRTPGSYTLGKSKLQVRLLNENLAAGSSMFQYRRICVD